MSFLKAKELREKRATIAKSLEEIVKLGEAREGGWSNEDQQKFDKCDKDLRDLSARIERHERLEGLQKNAALTQRQSQPETEGESRSDAGNGGKPGANAKPELRAAFNSYLRRGERGLNEQERSALNEMRGTNTQITGTDTLGGYLIPEEYIPQLEELMRAYGGMLGVVNILRSSTGGILKIPTTDDTNNLGAIIGETVTDVVSDIAFGMYNLGAYTYTSRIMKVSMEMMQDSAIDLTGHIMRVAAERLGRIQNRHLTIGTGTGQPTGVVTASTLGNTAAAVDGVTREEIVDLVHSLDPAYRGSNARFMFNDQTLAAIKKLAFGSADDRPLWQPSIQVGAPDRLEGFAYTINQDMPDLAAGQKAMLFGDFSKYDMRLVRGVEMKRLDEKYAEERVTGFMAFMRMDGGLRQPNAVKHLVTAAS